MNEYIEIARSSRASASSRSAAKAARRGSCTTRSSEAGAARNAYYEELAIRPVADVAQSAMPRD
jgi:hypothetical protein